MDTRVTTAGVASRKHRRDNSVESGDAAFFSRCCFTDDCHPQAHVDPFERIETRNRIVEKESIMISTVTQYSNKTAINSPT